MRISLVGLIALVGLMISGAAQAGVARCEGCTSAQFQSRAKSLGLGTHTITSLSTNVIKRYYVFDRNGGEPNTPTRLAATEMGVPTDLRGIFAAAVGFYQVTGGTMHTAVTVRADQLGVAGLDNATVFDVLSDANLRMRLGDYLARQPLPGVADQLESARVFLTQGLLGFVGVTNGSIKVIVVLDDDGTIVYGMNMGSVTAVYQKKSARTADGQYVPDDNSAENAGTWYGGGVQGYEGDLVQFAHYMEQLGATITGTGAGSMVCTWTPPTLTCELKRN